MTSILKSIMVKEKSFILKNNGKKQAKLARGFLFVAIK
jgi:hypothetical protein